MKSNLTRITKTRRLLSNLKLSQQNLFHFYSNDPSIAKLGVLDSEARFPNLDRTTDRRRDRELQGPPSQLKTSGPCFDKSINPFSSQLKAC
jgi:hypothetical protein